jgi:glycerophosphoryl diester phosphodiesterase
MKFYVKDHIISIAHRGYSGKYRDNSLQSFKKAYERNFDMIELDLQVCKTGELIINHDLMLNNKRLGDLPLESIRKIDKNIMTFREFIAKFPYRTKGLYLDLKGDIKTAYGLFAFIKTYDIDINNIIVCSFNMNHLDLLKLKIPKLKRGFITDNVFPENILCELIKDIHCIIFYTEVLSADVISYCKEKKVQVFAYTMRKKSDLILMDKYDLDGIVTNFKLTKRRPHFCPTFY